MLSVVLCVGTHVLALAAGFFSARLIGLDGPDQVAVGFAGSQKTLPVSLYLFEAYYANFPLAVVPMAFYHVGQLIVDTFVADWIAARSKAVPEPFPVLSDASGYDPG
jgi:sodium/bile acid cotransporter 7